MEFEAINDSHARALVYATGGGGEFWRDNNANLTIMNDENDEYQRQPQNTHLIIIGDRLPFWHGASNGR